MYVWIDDDRRSRGDGKKGKHVDDKVRNPCQEYIRITDYWNRRGHEDDQLQHVSQYRYSVHTPA